MSSSNSGSKKELRRRRVVRMPGIHSAGGNGGDLGRPPPDFDWFAEHLPPESWPNQYQQYQHLSPSNLARRHSAGYGPGHGNDDNNDSEDDAQSPPMDYLVILLWVLPTLSFMTFFTLVVHCFFNIINYLLTSALVVIKSFHPIEPSLYPTNQLPQRVAPIIADILTQMSDILSSDVPRSSIGQGDFEALRQIGISLEVEHRYRGVKSLEEVIERDKTPPRGRGKHWMDLYRLIQKNEKCAREAFYDASLYLDSHLRYFVIPEWATWWEWISTNSMHRNVSTSNGFGFYKHEILPKATCAIMPGWSRRPDLQCVMQKLRLHPDNCASAVDATLMLLLYTSHILDASWENWTTAQCHLTMSSRDITLLLTESLQEETLFEQGKVVDGTCGACWENYFKPPDERWCQPPAVAGDFERFTKQLRHHLALQDAVKQRYMTSRIRKFFSSKQDTPDDDAIASANKELDNSSPSILCLTDRTKRDLLERLETTQTMFRELEDITALHSGLSTTILTAMRILNKRQSLAENTCLEEDSMWSLRSIHHSRASGPLINVNAMQLEGWWVLLEDMAARVMDKPTREWKD